MVDQDDSEQSKEVYAYFGLAYYLASVFESGLTNATLQLDYLRAVKDRKPETFDRPTYEAGFDAFMRKQQAATLGTLIKRLQALADLPPDLQRLLAEVVERRNFLAHHFFRERATDFMTPEGRDRMLAELKSDCTLFDEADHALGVIIEPYRRRLGISDETMQRLTARYLQEQGIASDVLSE